MKNGFFVFKAEGRENILIIFILSFVYIVYTVYIYIIIKRQNKMTTFNFQTLNITESKDGKMFVYTWTSAPTRVLEITTNRLRSKSRLGISELVQWQQTLNSL
jgi:hypothetical protein